MQAAVPPNESERLQELHSYGLLDTPPEQAFDDITLLASIICGTPMALVSLVDEDRQWFKARVGVEFTSTSREVAFCSHTILDPDNVMVVKDTTEDERFKDNPLTKADPPIRFYAGAPLVTDSGNAMGALCVMDQQARELTPQQEVALAALSRQVVAQMELRTAVRELEQVAAERERYSVLLERYQSQLEERLTEVSVESVTDPLTGLLNRRALMDRLEDECARSRRSGRPVSVAMLDVDNFKQYNDTHGHVMGDRALAHVADVLERVSRPTDLMARYGGEEFAAVMSDTGPEGAYVLAERLRTTIERTRFDGPSLTVSIGVATFRDGEDDPLALIERADEALYEAKRKGRNRVAIDRVEHITIDLTMDRQSLTSPSLSKGA